MVAAIISACVLKNLTKIGELLCSRFSIEDERKNPQHIMLYYFKKGKNENEAKKKWFMQCMQKVLWLKEHVGSGLQNFVLEISCWMMLHGQVDQLKLIAMKTRH